MFKEEFFNLDHDFHQSVKLVFARKWLWRIVSCTSTGGRGWRMTFIAGNLCDFWSTKPFIRTLFHFGLILKDTVCSRSFSPIGFKVSLLTTLFAVCVDRIQGGNVWIFERTLASKKYSVCVSEKVSDQPLTYVTIRQIGGPVKHFWDPWDETQGFRLTYFWEWSEPSHTSGSRHPWNPLWYLHSLKPTAAEGI